MRSRFDFANPASNMTRFVPFKRRNAGVTGVINTLHLPWLPLNLLAVCAFQPAIGKPAVLAALVMAVMTISAEVLTRRLTTKASKKCRGVKQASPTYWI
jgi:ABC-type protease/lipase transport system fused ATPase/permease subunit